MTVSTDVPYAMTRLGVVMAPDPDDPFEAEGVLNPASGRTPDGRLHLLPRMVAAGNVSRIGLAEVDLRDGVPVGVHRRGRSPVAVPNTCVPACCRGRDRLCSAVLCAGDWSSATVGEMPR